MNNPLRKLQTFGCSLRGIQALMRRGDVCVSASFLEELSDADWTRPYDGAIHVNELPEELLLKIFSFLPERTITRAVLFVCSYWYKVANDPLLWRQLSFRCRANNHCYLDVVRTVNRHFRTLRALRLTHFTSTQQLDRLLWHVGNKCAYLTHVHLANCSVRSDALVRLGMTCPHIESLSLFSCDENYRKQHYRKAYMRDASFVVSFPKLTSLVLFRSLANLSYDDAQTIVRVCKNLKKLMLDCDFYGRAIRLIISSLCDSMEVLWLQGRNYNDSMCREISRCHGLRVLGLCHLENITPFGLNFLGPLTHLETLFLVHSTNISASSFGDFFASNSFPRLRFVHLSSSLDLDEDLRELIRTQCPSIRHVSLHSSEMRRLKTRRVAYDQFGIDAIDDELEPMANFTAI